MILYAKFGEHQPLNRQSASYAREGIERDTSTLADWVGACTATLMPLDEAFNRARMGPGDAAVLIFAGLNLQEAFVKEILHKRGSAKVND